MPPKKVYAEPEERVAPLDPTKVEEMLAILIRNQEAFEAVAQALKVEHLSAYPAYKVVWRAVREFYRDFAELPDRGVLTTELADRMAANPSLLVREEAEKVDQLIEFAYSPAEHLLDIATSKQHCKVAVTTVRRFLTQRLADGVRKDAFSDKTYAANLPAMLQEYREHADALATLSEVKVDVPFPEGWDKRKDVKLYTSGNQALDAFMGGGWRGGEVILFMGPFGSCKTSLTCSAVAEAVLYASTLLSSKTARLGKKSGKMLLPIVVLAFTESNIDEYRNRLVSHLATVDWKRLSCMESLSDLSDAETPGAVAGTEYEKVEFAEEKMKEGFVFESEQERVRAAAALCNRHLLLIDCTDGENNKHNIGSGGMEELATVIRGILRARPNCYPLAIWVDHISAMVDRMSERIKNEDELRRELMNMPRVVEKRLGKPLNVPIALMHQFSGAANAKGPVAKFDHTDSEGSKSIAKYAVFSFVTGKVDGNGMCRWQCTKHRREPPSSERFVRVMGQFNRIVDLTDKYTVDPSGSAIVSKSELDTFNQVANLKGHRGLRSLGGDTTVDVG